MPLRLILIARVFRPRFRWFDIPFGLFSVISIVLVLKQPPWLGVSQRTQAVELGIMSGALYPLIRISAEAIINWRSVRRELNLAESYVVLTILAMVAAMLFGFIHYGLYQADRSGYVVAEEYVERIVAVENQYLEQDIVNKGAELRFRRQAEEMLATVQDQNSRKRLQLNGDRLVGVLAAAHEDTVTFTRHDTGVNRPPRDTLVICIDGLRRKFPIATSLGDPAREAHDWLNSEIRKYEEAIAKDTRRLVAISAHPYVPLSVFLHDAAVHLLSPGRDLIIPTGVAPRAVDIVYSILRFVFFAVFLKLIIGKQS